MGQQLNKTVKRRRRKAYLTRKKALVKLGASRSKVGRSSKPSGDEEVKPATAAKKATKKAAKPATKKAAKSEAPAVDTPVVETPASEETTAE